MIFCEKVKRMSCAWECENLDCSKNVWNGGICFGKEGTSI